MSQPPRSARRTRGNATELVLVILIASVVTGAAVIVGRFSDTGGLPQEESRAALNPSATSAEVSPSSTANAATTTPDELPPDKATIEVGYAQDAATSEAMGVTPPPFPETPTPDPNFEFPTMVAGIADDERQGPFSPSDFQVRNTWRGSAGGGGDEWLVVYAGAKMEAGGGAIESPAVRIYTISTITFEMAYVDTVFAPLPPEAGALRLTGSEGETLQLEADDGQTTQFDLTAMQFE